MHVRLLLMASLAAVSLATPLAQGTPPSASDNDLDAFMSRVLARRDENWKKLQQYVLEERETLHIVGPGATPLYGVPARVGVVPTRWPVRQEPAARQRRDRQRGESTQVRSVQWLKREDMREKRRAERAAKGDSAPENTSTTPLTEDGVRQALEPGFVSAAYFLRFKFDPNHYALAGREQFEGRDVLKIEYYPSQLFREGRTRPNKEVRKRGVEIENKMNKNAVVTLWVDPAEHQILKYDFENVDLDFLPGRSLVRIDGMNAAMEMGQPFPSVWLPRSLRIGFDVTMALGEFDGRYSVEYHDYKLATVTSKVR